MWCTPWCTISGHAHHLMWCCDVSSNYDITYEHPWCHLWCHLLHYCHMHAQPIKGATWHLSGVHGFGSIHLVHPFIGEVLVYAGIYVLKCLCFWSLLPSEIIDWVVVCYCHEHPHHIDTFTHSRSVPWALAILSTSTISAGPLYLWLVPVCTIFITLIGLHHRKHLATGVAPCHLAHLTHHNSWCPWVGTNWIWVAQIMDLVPPWLWPKSSSVATGKREMSIMLSYLEG